MTKLEEKWFGNYTLLRVFIEEHECLPNKRRVENRALLNWWKYNKRMIKQGRLNGERIELLAELDNMRKVKR